MDNVTKALAQVAILREQMDKMQAKEKVGDPSIHSIIMRQKRSGTKRTRQWKYKK